MEPEGASYYAEADRATKARWTQQEQLQLLDTHPMFTGRWLPSGLALWFIGLWYWDCSV